jgi:hypothetical protein
MPRVRRATAASSKHVCLALCRVLASAQVLRLVQTFHFADEDIAYLR